VREHAVAGGSDYALSCDLLAIAEDARIGYMPTRVGLPATAMWTLGSARRAKRLMFTGDTLSGLQAAEWPANPRCRRPARRRDAAAGRAHLRGCRPSRDAKARRQ
jgi:enoyl-CoA hydratase